MKIIEYLFVLNTISVFVYGFDLKDADLTTPQLIEKYGYTSETHFTITDDGYILQLHRITNSPKIVLNSNTKNVVLLIHGATTTSADYVLAGPKVALAYYLSDLGYDVWMGNYRGNRYSRHHTTLSPLDTEFWRYTWDELAVYDLSSTILIIYYALPNTKRYRTLDNHWAMAPVVYLARSTNPVLRFGAHLTNTIEVQQLNREPYEFLPNTIFMRTLGKTVCGSRVGHICLNIWFVFCGTDTKFMDEKLLVILLGHIPSGISNMAVAQVGQMLQNDRFGKFDYGKQQNLKKYGQTNPPDYNLSNNIVPVMLVY